VVLKYTVTALGSLELFAGTGLGLASNLDPPE
jgi:hypothetical protein